MSLFTQGIVLEQQKEPALSREIRQLMPDEIKTFTAKSKASPEEYTPEELLSFAEKAGIIDEGDGKTFANKLRQAKENPPALIYVDALDDEPYISSQMSPVLQYSEEVLRGLDYVKKIIGVEKAEILVCRDPSSSKNPFPMHLGKVKVRKIRGVFPAEYSSRKKLRQKNAIMFGGCALIHFCRAVEQFRKQTTCFVTVAGNCIGYSCNYEVPIGTSVHWLLETSGLAMDPKRVVIGGSMTGRSIRDTEQETVQVLTRGILAFADEIKEANFRCVGCRRCVEVCPQGLFPQLVYKYARQGFSAIPPHLDVMDCIGCGTCSYACPAKLDLSNIMMKAKAFEIQKEGASIEA